MASIHEVNDEEEYIDLVPKGDVNGLAEILLSILKDLKKLQIKGEILYFRALEMFDNKPILADLLSAYHVVINDYKNNFVDFGVVRMGFTNDKY